MAEQTAEPNTATALARFTVHDAEIAKMREEYMPLTIAGIDDKKGAETVHKARMVCVKARTSTEKVAKELTAEARKYIEGINGEKNRILGLVAPIEDHLKAEESRIEQEIAAERTRLWRKEEERKRLAEEAAEAERQKKIAEENERLAQQRAELERQMAELNAARQKQEEEAAAARAAQEAEAARLAAERQAIEDSRRRIEEAAAAERQRLADAEADKERLRLAALIPDVPTDAEMDRDSAEAFRELPSTASPFMSAYQEIDRTKREPIVPHIEFIDDATIPKEELRPHRVSPFLQEDAAKLHTVAACIRGIDVPSMATTEGQAAAARVNAILDRAAAEIRDVALGLTSTPDANYDSDGNEMVDDDTAPF